MLDKKVEPYPEVTCTEFEDEGVLLNLETKTYYTLNKPGIYVWQLINNGLTPSEIVHRVKEEFEIDEETAENNVSNLIHELIREQLVKVIDE
ncbi:MAG TPA: PqqD family protein [Thermodesulfobacteriota bacterium]|nr:PqqD family protein [Thermodesulfobacteriota bacterium]